MAEQQTLHATAKTVPMILKKAADFGGTCKYPVMPAAFSLRPSPPAAAQGHMAGSSAAYREQIRPISFRADESEFFPRFSNHIPVL